MEHTTDQLRRFLLGEAYEGIGLIRRVEQRVEQLAGDIGKPSMRVNWYIPTQGSAHDQSDDDGLVERLTELAVALVEWEGKGIGRNPASQRHLIGYLRRNHITDVCYLLGGSDSDLRRASEDDRVTLRTGKLEQTWHRVQGLLAAEEPTEAERMRCESLAGYLVAWLHPCAHSFELMPCEDPRIEVLRCSCGAGFSRAAGEMSAVGG